MYLSGYYEEFYEFLVKKFSKALPKALADKKKKNKSKIPEFLLQNNIRMLLKNA